MSVFVQAQGMKTAHPGEGGGQKMAKLSQHSCWGSFFNNVDKVGTLTCQIIVQDHLIVQVADFSEINKRVGLNRAVQEGFFLIYVGENQV